jgi:septum formation protein
VAKNQDMKDYKLILASKSPRRKQLLTEAGFEFEIRTKDVEESYPKTLVVHDVPAFLSDKKAEASRDLIQPNEILLAADSVVILKNEIYEKPKDEADAFRIIKALSGNMHEVVTGVTLLSLEKKVTFSDVAKVYFNELTDEEIWYYVKTFQPMDKAGAYAIQEWIGLTKISKIEGSYYNIMGLPVHLVYAELQRF